jgi:hypothetical protein
VEAAGPLAAVVRRLRNDPDHPAGTPDGALRFLTRIRDACAVHPGGRLEVARSPADPHDQQPDRQR